jgi:hypothetical protein
MLAAGAAASACSSSPVAPAGTATVASASTTSPANGASIANLSQPVTLSISNGYVSTGSAATYTFEVATDTAFNTKVVSQDVAQNSSGTTSLKLGTLPAGTDYYWHVKTTAEGTTTGYTATMKFSIGAAIVIQAPAPVSPLTGATGLSQTPTFTVTNAVRSGPVTAISYRFDVSTVSTFSTITQSATVAEQTTRTSWTPTTNLAGGTTYYWRVQAIDSASGITSAYATTQSVTTQVIIDLTKANYQRFTNVSAWPITAKIRAVEQDGNPPGPMCIDYDKRDSWPTSDFFGDPAVQVQANQWYIANIGGTWYAGSGENMRPNQICKQGQMTEAIGPDGTWGGPMDTWAPRPGELVGYMMTTPARFWPSMKTLDERSQIVIQPWIDTRFNSLAAIKK